MILTKKRTLCSPFIESDDLAGKFHLEMYHSMTEIAEKWSSIAPLDLFYAPEFLHCIENYGPDGITPYYGIVNNGIRPVGIIYFQLKYVRLKENLRRSTKESNCMINNATESAKQFVIDKVNFHTIISGNLLLTGKYGFHFIPEIEVKSQFELVEMAADLLAKQLSKDKIYPGLILLKDFFQTQLPKMPTESAFTTFKVQPIMLLNIRENWNTFNDYLDDMKSKYRVRARKALKLSSEIIKKTFESHEIAEHRATIMSLYRNIADEAIFNAFILHDEYFENLKKVFGNNMTFTTYWKGDEMVAFFTSIKNYHVLDAHFLGYNPKENAECQLYLNMLYDLVSEGIQKKCVKIDLSRTAIEIKSTVGAEAHEMYLQLKHARPMINKGLRSIIDFINPTDNYIVRSPFKDGTVE